VGLRTRLLAAGLLPLLLLPPPARGNPAGEHGHGAALGAGSELAAATAARGTRLVPGPPAQDPGLAASEDPDEKAPDWEALWRALQQPLPVGERARMVSEFGVDLGSGKRPRPFELSLARAGLGLDATLGVPRADWPSLSPAAAGVVVRLLPQGPDRAWALVDALAPGADADLLPQRLQEGFRAFVAAERAFEGPLATALAQALHRQARATWSAFCLEGILRRTGDLDGAAAALGELPRAAERQERADRAGRRAIVARGQGRLDLAWRHLGAVLATGGADGAQMLGLQALRRGARAEAAAHFGALLSADALGVASASPAPWAQRGFGVALLPQRD
jgi:hypothetical protein